MRSMRLAVAQRMVAIAAPLVLSAQNQAPRNGQASEEGTNATVTGCLAPGVEPNTFVLGLDAYVGHVISATGVRARGVGLKD